MASSLWSALLAPGELRAARVVHHPLDAELIRAYAVLLGPLGLLQGHLDLAAGRECFEQLLRFLPTLCLEGDVEVVTDRQGSPLGLQDICSHENVVLPKGKRNVRDLIEFVFWSPHSVSAKVLEAEHGEELSPKNRLVEGECLLGVPVEI